MTTPGLWNESFGQLGATLKALEDRGVTLEHLKLIRSDDRVADAVAETLLKQIIVTDSLINGMFMPAELKLQIAKQVNADRGWGFSEEDFEKLGSPPTWFSGRLCVVALEISLDTVGKTFEEAWHFAKGAQPGGWHWPELKSDVDQLRLLSGIEHKRGLRWRVVELAANWDKKDGIRPKDVRNPQTSPHSAVLWEAGFSPKWVQAMDGVNVPYVWIPGYEASISGGPAWSYAPYLRWNRVFRKVELIADHCELRYQYWAVPAFRE